MSTFKDSPELHQRVDYRIIINGWHKVYFGNAALDADIVWLDKDNYEIVEFSCHGLSNLFSQFNAQFNFPAYFHHSFDSLNDCLQDIEIKRTGLVIVLKHLDNLKTDDALCLLNMLVHKARLEFVIGKRLLILVQVDDKDFQTEYIETIKLR